MRTAGAAAVGSVLNVSVEQTKCAVPVCSTFVKYCARTVALPFGLVGMSE